MRPAMVKCTGTREKGVRRLTGVSEMNLDLCREGRADRFPFKYVSLTGFGRLFPWQQSPMFRLCVYMSSCMGV